MMRIFAILHLAITFATSVAATMAWPQDAQSVIISVEQRMSRAERAELLELDVLVGSFLGDGRYEAFVPSDIDLTGTTDFVHSMEPLSPSDKLDPALRDGHIPEHSRIADGQVLLNVRLFDVSSERAMTALSSIAASAHLDNNQGVWVVILLSDHIDMLAALPEVRSIAAPPEPGTLNTRLR